ncbi:hypothetical protein DW704_10950 [Coprobacillus sp. AM26-5AC]|jgi:hypothetical protein|nr:hypothetical protein DW704_10950 [Coprobacillus sp. AM26-5AC]
MTRTNHGEIAIRLYEKYSDEIIDLLVYKGILFEFECGFGSPTIEKGYSTLNDLLNNDGYDVELRSGCYYPDPNSGDTLYYIFNKNIFDYDEAFKIAEKKYLEINKDFL